MKFGYQAVYDISFFDAIDYASDNGFDFVSFDLNVPRFYIDELNKNKLNDIREYSEEKGVKLAFHAPGDNISLFSDYPLIRDGILKHFTKIIEAAETLNAHHVTVHPGNYPALRKAKAIEDDFSKEYSNYFSSILHDNLLQLSKVSKDVAVCVENFNFTSITMEVLEKLFNERNLFLTWDIAKTYDRDVKCNTMVQEFMYKHLNKIKEIHIHDMIRGVRSHEIVGAGDIDFWQYQEVFKLPDAWITIEVRPRQAAKVSLENIKGILEIN